MFAVVWMGIGCGHWGEATGRRSRQSRRVPPGGTLWDRGHGRRRPLADPLAANDWSKILLRPLPAPKVCSAAGAAAQRLSTVARAALGHADTRKCRPLRLRGQCTRPSMRTPGVTCSHRIESLVLGTSMSPAGASLTAHTAAAARARVCAQWHGCGLLNAHYTRLLLNFHKQ